MDDSSVEVTGTGPAKVAAFPKNYFDHAGLKLFFIDGKNRSVDNAGARKFKLKANAPHNYVLDLQTDLETLKYLPKGAPDGVFGAKTKRAVTRFQRHARRVYRMPGPADVAPADTFKGAETGECDQATAKEIRKWIANSWVLPLGRFPLENLNVTGATGHKLRSDAATEWEAIVKKVHDAGGILEGPYGDSTRGLSRAIASGSAGASGFSFHYCGRAVDINQGLAGGKGMRYFLQKEPSGGKTFWRVFCKTDKQDGSQGTKFARGAKRCFLPFNESEYDIPEGHYIDMTQMIEAGGTFERIAAQKGFDDKKLPKKDRQQKLEWWHFQYSVDKQPTFLDEIELIGRTEAQARAGGWKTNSDLDHPPG